jgi:hypothetical protein
VGRALGVRVPEQVATGVLATASPHGDAAYLAVAFGLFILAAVVLQQRWMTHRDQSHRDSLTEAYAMVTEMNTKRAEEARMFADCLRRGVNEAVIEIHKTADRSYAAIRETNAQLIAGIVEPTREIVRELKPVMQKSTAAVARAELVMEALSARSNGHA